MDTPAGGGLAFAMFRRPPACLLLALAACSGGSNDSAEASHPGFCDRKLSAFSGPARYEPAQSDPGYALTGIGVVLVNYAESVICVATR
jgi:hypothetical protein